MIHPHGRHQRLRVLTRFDRQNRSHRLQERARAGRFAEALFRTKPLRIRKKPLERGLFRPIDERTIRQNRPRA